jgi:hypothetical protein
MVDRLSIHRRKAMTEMRAIGDKDPPPKAPLSASRLSQMNHLKTTHPSRVQRRKMTLKKGVVVVSSCELSSEIAFPGRFADKKILLLH